MKVIESRKTHKQTKLEQVIVTTLHLLYGKQGIPLKVCENNKIKTRTKIKYRIRVRY